MGITNKNARVQLFVMYAAASKWWKVQWRYQSQEDFSILSSI